MNLNKLYYPTYEEWPAIEQRGITPYCAKSVFLITLMIASFLAVFYLYSILMMQTPYFAGYETGFANAMREIDLNYMLPKMLYFSTFGFMFSILINIMHWFRNKSLYKKGEAAWKAKREPNKTNNWIYQNGFTYWIVVVVVAMFASNYVDLIVNEKLLYKNTTDVIVGAMVFISPGIFLGAFVAKKNAMMNMPRKFLIESKQITVWPYSIPFLISLCILVAAALGYPI